MIAGSSGIILWMISLTIMLVKITSVEWVRNPTADSLRVPTHVETKSDTNESFYTNVRFRTLNKVDMCVPGEESSNAHLIVYLIRDPLIILDKYLHGSVRRLYHLV